MHQIAMHKHVGNNLPSPKNWRIKIMCRQVRLKVNTRILQKPVANKKDDIGDQ